MSNLISDVSEARSQLCFEYPFFGALSLYLDVVEDESVGTAATDGNKLFIAPQFWNKLSKDEKKWVIAHEVMHPALGHVFFWRKGHRQARLWNIAGDYIINTMLAEQRLIAPDGVLIDEKGIYKGDSTEEIYEKLLKNQNKCPQCGGTGRKGGGGSQSQGDQNKGKGKGSKGGDGDEEGQGGTPGSGEGDEPCDCAAGGTMAGDIREKQGNPSEDEKLGNEWRDRFVSAARSAKQRGRGDFPSGLERFLEELTNPQLPWEVILNDMVGELIRDDYDATRFDRRYLQMGFALPDIYHEQIKVVIGVDTSGSISNVELTSFMSEVWGILHSRNVSEVRIMACDAAVHFDETFNANDHCPSIPGGGGTNFIPVFERIEDEGYNPTCLIYFTDLDGRFPEEAPNYPVYWVTYDQEKSAPWGNTLRFVS